MTFTKKNQKTKTNKTRKNRTTHPVIKNLQVGFPLYAAKKYKGDEILEYNRKLEEKKHDHCLQENSSWFGSLQVAKWYNTKGTHIYKWKTKKPTHLLLITRKNEGFLKQLFLNTDIQLTPSVNLTKKNLKYEHPYLKMGDNEKAYFEFCFAFGYITIEEQYEFLKLVKYLIENDFIEMKRREGSSIANVITLKLGYYFIKHRMITTKKNKMNRLSFYSIDKYAIMNLCRLVNNPKYKIDGVYQKNDISFWFSQFITKRNIEEYILFNPHHHLVYEKMI